MRYLLIALFCFYPLLAQTAPLNDPTRPPGYQAPTDQQINTPINSSSDPTIKWVLDTTLISPYQKIAMLNGKRVVVGDTVNGAKVIKIDHQKVKLRLDSKVITVKLNNAFLSSMGSTSP